MGLFTKNYPPEIAPRIPPGQRLVKTWPVLHFGPIPSFDGANWDLEVPGLVEHPFRLTYEELRALPSVTVDADMHCVTGWTTLDNTWEGGLVPHDPRSRPAAARGEVGDRGVRLRLHVRPVARCDDRRRRAARVAQPRRGSHARARLAAAPRGAQALRVEEREMAHGPAVQRPERARVLGGARLSVPSMPAEERYSCQEGPRPNETPRGSRIAAAICRGVVGGVPGVEHERPVRDLWPREQRPEPLGADVPSAIGAWRSRRSPRPTPSRWRASARPDR